MQFLSLSEQLTRISQCLFFQCLAWVSTKFTNRSLDYPDIEIPFVSGSPASDGGNHIRKVSIADVQCASHVSQDHAL